MTLHSLHSFIAVKSFYTETGVRFIIYYPLVSEICYKLQIALDTTIALPSFDKFSNNFKNPCYSIN